MPYSDTWAELPQHPMLPMQVRALLSPREQEVLGWMGKGMKFDQLRIGCTSARTRCGVT